MNQLKGRKNDKRAFVFECELLEIQGIKGTTFSRQGISDLVK